MVHCWQWNGLGIAPGGLIEGIADYVRLRTGLSPAHWKKEGKNWDAGYQVTAYFLEWVEDKMGKDSVKKINQALQAEKYEEHAFWGSLFGRKVGDMWNDYLRSIGKDAKETEPETEKGSESKSLAKGTVGQRNEDAHESCFTDR